MPIENGMISKSIESAQKKVEGHNFDIRKHLVEYDDVMNVHRNIIYKRRKELLDKENIHEEVLNMMREIAQVIVMSRTEPDYNPKTWDQKNIFETLTTIYKDESSVIRLEEFEEIKDQQKLIEFASQYLVESYKKKISELPEESLIYPIEKAVFIRTNDNLWMEHIDEMSHLRETVAFSGYAQKDPLIEYKSQAFEMFNELIDTVRSNTVNTLFKIDVRKAVPHQMLAKSTVQNMQTNEDQVQAQLTGGGITHSTLNSNNPVIIKANSPKSVIQNQKSVFPKVGRNDPCPCGSGKKYKKCHGLNS